MSKVLVVCYSRSGSTNRVAIHLAEALGADLERIDDARPRDGVGGYMLSALEALAKGLPTIHTTHDPRDYDLVVLGTPVWTGTMSSPVRSYIARHRGAFRRAAFFAVMGGRGGEDTVREMQLACGTGDCPTLVLTQHDVEQNHHLVKCDDFVRALTGDGAGQSASRIAAA